MNLLFRKYSFLIALLPSIAAGQIKERLSSVDSIRNIVIQLYNRGQADSVYMLADESYHQFIAKEHFVQWLLSSRQETGEILTSRKAMQENGEAVYLTDFQNGQMNMILAIDKSGKIAGFGFRPAKKDFLAKSDNHLKNNMDSVVENVISSYIQLKNTVGVSVGIIDKGKFYTYNYGETTTSDHQLPDENTIYETGSVTKTFTATLLAEMVLHEKCLLSDQVNKYLPKNVKLLQKDGIPVTLGMLANHTSGLPRIPSDLWLIKGASMGDPYKNYDTTDLFNYIDSVHLLSVPGAYYAYSNLGFGLLGTILERISGLSYEQLLLKYVDDPLNMEETGTLLNDSQRKHFAQGYDANGNVAGHWHFTSMAGAGAILSSVRDMLKYLSAHLAVRHSDGLSRAFRLCEQPSFPALGGHIGLAWYTLSGSPNWYWHNGGTGGFSSYCAYNLQKQAAIVILSNSSLSVDDAGVGLVRALSVQCLPRNH